MYHSLPASRHSQRQNIPRILIITVLTVLTCAVMLVHSIVAKDWQDEFLMANRTLTPTGASKYSIISPGFQLVLASKYAKLTITVLDETKEINGIMTRVVEEREERHGALFEVSRNFVAIDQKTGDVFSFGETVAFYKQGKVVSHAGSWQAYTNGNRPGLIIPGDPHAGMTYYQELAPGVAMGRAEILSIADRVPTPAGTWNNCVTMVAYIKNKWLDLIAPSEYRAYAPGIGIVQEQDMKLVSYGYIKSPHLALPPAGAVALGVAHPNPPAGTPH